MLKGKVALVTGSTSGIGLAIARALAKEGADLMLNGFGEAQAIEKTRAGIEAESGVKVAWSGADLAQPAAVAGLVEYTVRRLGGIDVLCNNAGIQHTAPVERFPPEKWDAIMAINLSGAFHAIRAAAPSMKANGWGRVVNIASAHGHAGSPFKSAYVAAKHGIIGLTKVAALEYAEHGVTVNAVCPGYVWTPLVEKQIDEQAKSHNIPREQVVHDVFLKKHPNRRFATIDEIGATVAFLCSESAGSITGTSIMVDGGWTAE